MGVLKDQRGLVVYHGQPYRVEKPILLQLESQKDFGRGFYLTTDKQQAENFARMRMRFSSTNKGYVNKYFIDSFDGLSVLEFERADEYWFDFILANRNLKYQYNYDVAIGKIADDGTKAVLNDYLLHRFDCEAILRNTTPKKVAIDKLKVNTLKNQLCMHTKAAIARLSFDKASVIKG